MLNIANFLATCVVALPDTLRLLQPLFTKLAKSHISAQFFVRVFLGKCHFLPGGGAPENWGGSGTLSKIKRGIKRFFKLKRGGDHLYFLKK